MDLTGKTAIVTGASSGIGAATVRQLREAGVRVAGGARRVERIDADVALELDVTDEASSAAFVEAAVAALGGVDILFNNAGLALGRAPFTESTAEDEARVVHTNVDGVMRMTRLCSRTSATRGTSSSWARSRGGRRTRRRVVHHRRSSGCADSLRAARGPARPPDPDHDRRRRAGRDRVLDRPLQGRPGQGRRGVRGPRPDHAGRGRRLRHVRADAAAARQPRRDRDQGARQSSGSHVVRKT